MQRIEKYAVIALVLLLVTILAVSLWSQKKGKSPFSFFKKSSESTESTELAQNPASGGPNATGFDVTTVGNAPTTGLAPYGTQGAPQAGLDAQGNAAPANVNDPTLPADWKPGQPWVNRGRVAAQQQQVQDPAQPTNALPTGSGFVGAEQPVVTEPTGTSTPSAQPKSSAKPVARKSTPAAGPTYVVQSGDTLGEIAARELGSFDKWTEIAALNGNLDPKKLKKGQKIVLPAGAKTASKPKVNGTGAVAPGGEYVVQKGDTLSGIAQKVLGKGGRWSEIAALNPSIDPNRLIVGSRLRLPKGVATGSPTVAKADRKNRVR
ncbi:MAG: LysM peptidoglycan-binding domain-containing protein [Planctomycetes bacterium]|nr:LysM peptidoglycan-binding domain-containing protein [Planctomycetota bacterium]